MNVPLVGGDLSPHADGQHRYDDEWSGVFANDENNGTDPDQHLTQAALARSHRCSSPRVQRRPLLSKTVTDLRAREMKAANTFRGAGEEIGKTLPLEPGAVVITEGMVRLFANPLSQRPCYLRLPSPRLCVLEHYALRPDRLTEVPTSAV